MQKIRERFPSYGSDGELLNDVLIPNIDSIAPTKIFEMKNAPVTHVDVMNSIEETWKLLELQGERLTQSSTSSLFFRAMTAGIFVGFGGILTTSVGFDVAGVVPWMPGAGYARFMSGAIGFPLTILLAAVTGNGAWTGDALLIVVAYWNKRAPISYVLRSLLITYVGCFVGAYFMGMLAVGAALPAVHPCRLFAEHKLNLTAFQLLLRGMGAGCLICLAIFLATTSRTMTGKAIAIWFPISTYVICDFEHCLASMFFLATASMDGVSISLYDYLRVLVPATIGNLLGGAILVGIGLANVPKRPRVTDPGDICPGMFV